jgi:hypothetical protein
LIDKGCAHVANLIDKGRTHVAYLIDKGRAQWWANLDQASKDLDKTIFRDLSPTPIP